MEFKHAPVSDEASKQVLELLLDKSSSADVLIGVGVVVLVGACALIRRASRARRRRRGVEDIYL